MFSRFTIYEAGTSLDWDGDTEVSFLIFTVPSHNGIGGNEKADSAAKSALELQHAKVGVPYTDFKHCISQYILSTWQGVWNGCGCKQASFCQASPGRLAVLLQAVQEGWSCLVSCPHRSYIFDPFIYLEGSSKSVWALWKPIQSILSIGH